MKTINKDLRYKIARKLYYLAMIFDNSGNCNFNTNGEQKFIKKLFKDLTPKTQITLFDIGGNKGDYTQMLLGEMSNITQNFMIHVFEPTQYCFDKLSSRFDDNKIVLNNVACSDLSGKGKIYYDIEGSGLASMCQRTYAMYDTKLNIKEEIKTERLDEYIKQKEIKHIDFMKVDVEGYEMVVFEGMGRYLNSNFIDYIQFEYGGANLDSMTSLMKFYKLFESKGFKLSKVMPSGLQMRTYEPFLEVFEYSNYVAISKKLIKIALKSS